MPQSFRPDTTGRYTGGIQTGTLRGLIRRAVSSRASDEAWDTGKQRRKSMIVVLLLL